MFVPCDLFRQQESAEQILANMHDPVITLKSEQDSYSSPINLQSSPSRSATPKRTMPKKSAHDSQTRKEIVAYLSSLSIRHRRRLILLLRESL